MRIITLVTQKGGTGKSTLTTSLAVAAVQAGEKVIAFDLDPQGTLTAWAHIRQQPAPSVAQLPARESARLAEVLKACKRNCDFTTWKNKNGPAASGRAAVFLF
jgi:chromosome partitioning protein